MRCFESISSALHGCEYRSICVGALQSLPLHLDRRERSIDLLQLLFVSLLSLESLDSGWRVKKGTKKIIIHTSAIVKSRAISNQQISGTIL